MATYTTVADATAAIQAHSICSLFMATPMKYVVYYPPSYTVPGGALVDRGGDDLAALNLLYDQIDTFWNAQRLQIAAQ